MQQTMVKRGLASGLLVLLMAMAGCEDPPLPTSVPVANASASPSPSPSASPSASATPGASPSVRPSQTPQPTAAPTVTPRPSATPTSTTAASTAPAGSPSPSIADPPTAVGFELPAPNADFTASSLQVRVRVEVPTNVTLQKITVQYDGRTIYEQKNSALVASFQWNPQVLPLPDGTTEPVNAGAHTLTAIATTIAGTQLAKAFDFDKPYAFKSWASEYAVGKSYPALPQVRDDVKLVADEADDQLFALFGTGSDGVDMVAVSMLSITNLGQPSVGTWMGLSSGGLVPRRDAAVTALNEHIYILGGSIAVADPNNLGAMIMVPTASAKVYNVKQELAQAMPDLPSPVTDAQTAVLNGYLYLYGGSTDGTAAGTTNAFYRLKLDDAGNVAGTAWEPLTNPGADTTRRGGALVATGNTLYLVGGQNASDVFSRVVYAYTPPTDTVAGSWADHVTLSYGVAHAAIAGLGGKIYIAGGIIDNTGKRTNTVVEIDPSLRTLQTLPTGARLPSARSGLGAAVINGQLFVAGGSESGQDSSGNATDNPLDGVLRSIAY